jgi:hypothetical protein
MTTSLFDGDTWASYADVKATPTWQLANNVLPFFGTATHTVLASSTLAGITVP